MSNLTEFIRTAIKTERGAFLLVFVLTLLLRIPFLIMVRSDPTFQMPVIDSLEFTKWSYWIIHGKILWTTLQNHTPLYAYFLALIFLAAGFNFVIVALVQYVLFALSTALLYLVVARTVNQATGLVCSLFMATYWFFIYANTFVFSENLSLFLDVCFLYVLVCRRDTLKKYVLAGLLLGLTNICRPEMLPFLALLPFWLAAKKLPGRDAQKYYCAVLIMTLLVMVPVVVQNYRISGEITLRTQLGANIFMGNNPAFRGTNAGVEIGHDWTTFISQPHMAAKRTVGSSESDRYFIGKTFEGIQQDPVGWLRLILSKTFSILTGREFLRTEDVYIYNNYMINTPFAIVSTKMLYLLGLAGLVIGLFQFSNLLIFYLFFVTYAPMVFLPIKTRYLMPNIPLTIVFAAVTIVYLFSAIRSGRKGLALAFVGGLFVLNLAADYNPLRLTVPDVSETYYAIAKNYATRSRDSDAIDYFKWAIEVNPRNISAHNDLGVLLMNLQNYEEALSYFEKAMAIDSSAPYPRLNAERCRKKMLSDKR
jgi:uncharacterized membrane protein